MYTNKWTLALAAAGVVSFGSIAQAEEAQNNVMTALSQTTLSGYVETSAIWKPGTGNAPLPGRIFDGADKTDGFNLHVVNLKLEKPLDEGQWSAGYKADLLFGPDANWFEGSILNGGAAGASAFDDFGIKQAYVVLRAPVGNGLDIKMGVWDAIIGYEVFESGNNPNFSRSYGFALEPRQHTGVLASYHVTDSPVGLSISAGVADSFRGAINDGPTRAGAAADESEKTYMASVTIVLPESAGPLSGTAIYAGVVDGLNGGANFVTPTNSKDTTSYYAGLTVATPLEGLSLGAAADYREDAANAVTPGKNWAWALAGYASYQATEKMKLNLRGDWTKGSDGTFYNAGAAGSDTQNELVALTATLDYTLWSAVLTRAEVRWDHSLNGDRPFADLDRNAVTVAANVIYKF